MWNFMCRGAGPEPEAPVCRGPPPEVPARKGRAKTVPEAVVRAACQGPAPGIPECRPARGDPQKKAEHASKSQPLLPIKCNRSVNFSTPSALREGPSGEGSASASSAKAASPKPAVPPFQDSEFPAGPSSIGNDNLQVDWCRVKHLMGMERERTLFGDIGANNFEQGNLGDCWLLAAIACATDFPGHIMDLFSPREYSPEGRYEVQLYDIQHGWQTVVVDDWIPCHAGTNQPIFCQAKRGGFWPLLLEKAFAKFVGSYQGLDGGSQAWANQVLTGVAQQKAYQKERKLLSDKCWQEYATSVLTQQAQSSKWRTNAMKNTPKTLTGVVGAKMLLKPCFAPEEFFKQVAYYDQCNFLISASIDGASNREVFRPDGLFENHAYSVLKLQKAHGVCMIKLRNPWGDDEWNGRFSRRSTAWRERPELLQDLCPDLGPEPTGEFWMTWLEFEAIFTEVDVSPGCLPVPKRPQKQHSGALPTCGMCGQRSDRRWCLTDLDGGEEGDWVRLRSGDLCLPCRRAHRGPSKFQHNIAGIDVFLCHPRPKQPEPPRMKPVCKCGPACREHDPEHFAQFHHPWLL